MHFSDHHSSDGLHPLGSDPICLALTKAGGAYPGDKGTLALWLLPDSRMRLIWSSQPQDILCRNPDPANRTRSGPPLNGVLTFSEDLVRVQGMAALQHLPWPAGLSPGHVCRALYPIPRDSSIEDPWRSQISCDGLHFECHSHCINYCSLIAVRECKCV